MTTGRLILPSRSVLRPWWNTHRRAGGWIIASCICKCIPNCLGCIETLPSSVTAVVSGVFDNYDVCCIVGAPGFHSSNWNKDFSEPINGTHVLTKTGACIWTKQLTFNHYVWDTPNTTCSGAPTDIFPDTITITYTGCIFSICVSGCTHSSELYFNNTLTAPCLNCATKSATFNSTLTDPQCTGSYGHGGTATITY